MENTKTNPLGEALVAFAEDPPRDLDDLEILLERLGDALRLDVDIPASIRPWLRDHLEGSSFDTLVRSRAEALARVTVPTSEAFEHDEDGPARLELAVADRDRAESLRAGLQWSALTAGQPEWLATLRSLEEAAEGLSQALIATVDELTL